MDVGYCNGSPTALSIVLGISGGSRHHQQCPVLDGRHLHLGCSRQPDQCRRQGMGRFHADPEVIAVMFSPSTTSDAEIMAVYTLTVGSTYLASHYGANALAWNAYIPACTIVAVPRPPMPRLRLAATMSAIPARQSWLVFRAQALPLVTTISTKSPPAQPECGTATDLLVGGTGIQRRVFRRLLSTGPQPPVPSSGRPLACLL